MWSLFIYKITEHCELRVSVTCIRQHWVRHNRPNNQIRIINVSFIFTTLGDYFNVRLTEATMQREIFPETRPGRLSTSTDDSENHARTSANRRLTVIDLVEKVEISVETYFDILKEKLNMHRVCSWTNQHIHAKDHNGKRELGLQLRLWDKSSIITVG